ncbi:NAD-dependent epimerase/dehydratase family protein [Gammaproteobacteria bacterium]|nr:NAD-dependent epimerase/dehydratase family protein [Gammaproteobacteria bacterium]
MNNFSTHAKELLKNPRKWLVTGCAGFIGSNLLETLLLLEQKVVGLDNFSTGNKNNLLDVEASVSPSHWKNFQFIEGDITDFSTCLKSCKSVDYVLHQAALGSVPRSIENPINTNYSNIVGHLNMITAAKDCNVKSFTYAASSSSYGDHPDLPKVEDKIGNPLSPYAVTKLVNELYANVFSLAYNFHSIGLRYFNVFGKRQDPGGAYAAVIPRWIRSMIQNEKIFINGDGSTSRDFCFIDNVIQANILSAMHTDLQQSEVFNIAVGGRTSLNELFNLIQTNLKELEISYELSPEHRDFREGDVKHSQASIIKAAKILGYHPEFNIQQGISKTVQWYSCR